MVHGVAMVVRAPALSQRRFTHPHVEDFNGDRVPDVAFGEFGAIELVYLRDSADDPVLYRRRIEHGDVDLGIGEYVPYTTPIQPYTDWPVRLLTLPDLDGNGADDLWTSARRYESLDGQYRGLGAQILFLSPPEDGPAASSPVLHASPLPPEHFPTSNRSLAEMGSIVARIGDVNGDGYTDMLVSAGRDCDVRCGI